MTGCKNRNPFPISDLAPKLTVCAGSSGEQSVHAVTSQFDLRLKSMVEAQTKVIQEVLAKCSSVVSCIAAVFIKACLHPCIHASATLMLEVMPSAKQLFQIPVTASPNKKEAESAGQTSAALDIVKTYSCTAHVLMLMFKKGASVTSGYEQPT